MEARVTESVTGMIGAIATDRAAFTASIATKPAESRKPAEESAAASAQAASTARGAESASANRPPIGPANSRTADPAASTIATSAGSSPRDASTAGRKGRITPKAKNWVA